MIFRSEQRLAELSAISSASIFNQVYPLQKPDYAKDVTEASKKAYVVVLLTSSLGTNVESRLLTEIWRELAGKFGDIKFCEIRADMCIEGYPERNTPTILVYKDGDIQRQIVTLRELQGPQTSAKGMPYEEIAPGRGTLSLTLAYACIDVEDVLVSVGALAPNDIRRTKPEKQRNTENQKRIRSGKKFTDSIDPDSIDDWD